MNIELTGDSHREMIKILLKYDRNIEFAIVVWSLPVWERGLKCFQALHLPYSEKGQSGQLWARESEGKGLFLMAWKQDELGRNVRQQLLAAIN